MSRATTSLYEAVSAGQRHVGMEHWLPLFHERLETLIDYCPEAIVTSDHQIAEAFEARLGADRRLLRRAPEDRRQGRHVAAAPTTSRCRPSGSTSSRRNGTSLLEGHSVGAVHQLRCAARRAERDRSRRPPPRGLRPGPHGAGRQPVRQGGRAREGRQRRRPPGRDRGLHRRLGGAPARISCRSMAPRRRCRCPTMRRSSGLPPGVIGVAVWPLEHGFVLDGLEVIGEEDILGDRLSRPASASAGRRSASSPRRRRSAKATWSCIASTASAATKAW